jgi:hypothetical protein
MSKKIMGKAHHIRIFGFHTKKSLNYADGVSYGVDSSSGGPLSFMGSGMEEEAKSAAAYNAAVSNKADVIVAPQYFVKVKSYVFGLYKEVNAQIWGYSGKIIDIKKSKKHQME